MTTVTKTLHTQQSCALAKRAYEGGCLEVNDDASCGETRNPRTYKGDMMINTKRLAEIGLALIEEAVLATLCHEPTGLKPSEIGKRLGIENEDYSYLDRSYPIVRGILNKLEKENLVEPDGSKHQPKYRLTESDS